MSRGLGKVQREILTLLQTRYKNREEVFASDLCYQVSDCCDEVGDIIKEPTAAQWQSFWRALRKLEEKGIVACRNKPTGFFHRIGNKVGGSSHCKMVKCLVHGNSAMN